MIDIDIEELNVKFDSILSTARFDQNIHSPDDANQHEAFLRALLVQDDSSPSVADMKRAFGIAHLKNSVLLHSARSLSMCPSELKFLTEKLRIKRGKSHSGVLVITVFTSDQPSYVDESGQKTITQRFSCKWNCYYCPNEPGQPRSYLKGEPGVLRANRYGFDACAQMWGRMDDLASIGHDIDKLEVLVLGGTWTSYPLAYREQFVRDLYYAANAYYDRQRPRTQLWKEKASNQIAAVKLIGLTLETRPDTITVEEIMRFREYGCTRIQLGVQHLDADVLQKINRKCTTAQVVHAVQLLLDHGYKIDAHWMPNLPGSTAERDRAMFVDCLLKQSAPMREVAPRVVNVDRWEIWSVAEPQLQFDQWKIYPCEVVPWTVIEKWYKAGTYVPYSEDELREVLIDTKVAVFPWIRLNRIIRDIPSDYIMTSGDVPNMRQELLAEMQRRNLRCQCIRCREVKLVPVLPSDAQLWVREYAAAGGTEYFISIEEPRTALLLGFCRLRIPSQDCLFTNVAWIRELHVYGMLQVTQRDERSGDEEQHNVQHHGLGIRLIRTAEQIAHKVHGRTIMAIIAGEGTKRYYKDKLGYTEDLAGMMTRRM